MSKIENISRKQELLIAGVLQVQQALKQEARNQVGKDLKDLDKKKGKKI